MFISLIVGIKERRKKKYHLRIEAVTEKDKNWVYVVVCEPEGSSSFLGLHDQEKKIDYIPVFETKENAQDCFLSLPREKGKKHEIQAVHIEELIVDAKNNGFEIAFVDGDGKIIPPSEI